MQAPSSLGASELHPSLVDELRRVANSVLGAAAFADGEYIPQMTREQELRAAYRAAAHAGATLEQLALRVARLDGADDGLRLVKAAIVQLDQGRGALHDGVVLEDDPARGAAIVVDSVAIGSAGSLFRSAAAFVLGLADLALLESMSPDEAFARLLSGS